MISRRGKPALASKARLRPDAKSGGYLLLYPERGLALNGTAASILKLCSGDRTVEAIVAELGQGVLDRSEAELEIDVIDFLQAMVDRGLVRVLE